MFTIDNTAGLFKITATDMLAITLMANDVKQGLITDAELDKRISTRWPAVTGEPRISARAWRSIKLTITTIATEVK